MEAPRVECAIEDLVNRHPDLYLEPHVTAFVAVVSEHSPSPCAFRVECLGVECARLHGAREFALSVSWSVATVERARRIRRTEQRKGIVERAAIALACLLISELLDGSEMRVTRYGDAADYWIPDLRVAVEVSGTEFPERVARRQREKAVQVLRNSAGWDGYVVIACFSPTQPQIVISFERQEAVRR